MNIAGRLHHSRCGVMPCRERRYVFSLDVARALVETNAIAPLKFMPNEDATFGFWVRGMYLPNIDQPKVGYTGRLASCTGHRAPEYTCRDSLLSCTKQRRAASC